MIRKLLFSFLLVNLGLTAVWAQDRQISGKVTSSEDGSGVPGVNVIIQGSSRGTATDIDGKFTLVSGSSDDVLVFTFVGFKTVTVPVAGKTEIDVALDPDITSLGEVVVVGYGTQRKVDITGAVVQLKGSEISSQPSVNPISALQGKVAGVQITNSGAPGASPQIRIRGAGTVYGNPNPLYVVDGVWYDDISFLNPNDIENMSILKDASSEAIYGIRAANGVVLISTKKGSKNSGMVVSYNGFVGTQIVTNQVKMANGPQYATMINELDQISGRPATYANPESYGTTNWYDQIMRAALITNHQISLSGGAEKSTYNFSFGYLKQDGTVQSNSFDRYTARLQNDYQPFKFLKFGYTVTGAVNKSKDINNGIFLQMYAAAPIVPVFNADGSYGDPNNYSVGNGNRFNPQATIDFYDQKSQNYRITGNMFAEATFAKHFTFRTSLGGDFGQNELRRYTPVSAPTVAQTVTTSSLAMERAETRNWLLENTLTYEIESDKHSVKILAGQSAQQYKYYHLTASALNVPNNSSGDHYLTLGDPASRLANDDGTLSTVSSYFGRVNYSFMDRYLINASMRADGASKFAGKDKWGYFPSVGAGWVISEESFMQNQEVVSNLKLRASWGKIGNISVPANTSVLRVSQTDDLVYVGGNGATAPGANVNMIVPPATFWERGVGTDIGLEASFFNNKFTAEIDFYNKKTEKAIFAIPVLGSIGTSDGLLLGNNATFENKGFEFLLSYKDKIQDKITFSISGNLGINENKVLDVSTGSNPIYQAVGTTGGVYNTRTVQGQPIGQFYGLKVEGIFQSQEDINSYVSNTGAIIQSTAQPGDFKYQDVNGDGVIDDKDRVVLGNPNPKFTYGINTNWAYKAFDLTLDFQGVAGVDIYNANLGLRYGTENFTEDFYKNRWHGEGTSNSYPSANIGGGQNYRSNSFYVEKGDYFRIRNIQLGYTINTGNTGISKLRVYANAQNALTFFNYRGFNPEVSGDPANAGNPTKAGVDVNVYPLYATYNLGVNLTF